MVVHRQERGRDEPMTPDQVGIVDIAQFRGRQDRFPPVPRLPHQRTLGLRDVAGEIEVHVEA